MKLFYLLVAPVVSARAINTQQVPVIGGVEKEVVQSTTYEDDAPPAVGVHFTTSYAIAAARYLNGTTQDLAKVEGGAAYVDLVSRWADQERTVGMEQDAAVLADFMKKTRDVMEIGLDMRISHIAPTFPYLPTYANQAVREALSSAGLTSTRAQLLPNELAYDEVTAAEAAPGHDLHSSAEDHTSQMKSAPNQNVLYVNFDNSSFSIGAMSLRNAGQELKPIRYDINTQLGWWNMPVYDIPRAKFWTRIHEMILHGLEPMSRPPNRIVLMGDHGADEEFKQVVTAAVWERYEFDVELMLSAVRKEDAGRLAARGAAELAWRDGIRQREREAVRQKEEVIEL
ncbi:hypothetical protein IQ06DRAFT_278590 [Phaeosphaeriaceae sp. SRC1lsM3a]|nr:hypothetical protein IQ06DRAFT_278590 [Stagonospora sp. SRC1lsM3a]